MCAAVQRISTSSTNRSRKLSRKRRRRSSSFIGEAGRARQEPITALVLLAGIAAVLWTPVASTLLDDPARDGLVVAVWAFIGGGIYGIVGYWLAGALVYGAERAAGSEGSYRRARHVVAFAAAPLALSL